MRLTVAEALKLINDAPDRQSAVNAILNFQSPIMEQIFQYALWDEITFDLPPGVPPFTRDEDAPLGMSYTTLEREANRLYLFLKGYATNVPALKKEQLFIDLLSGLHPSEADVLIAVKEKTFETVYPNITYELVYSTIPQLLPPPETRAKKVVSKPVVAPQPITVKEEVTISEENLSVKPTVDKYASLRLTKLDENVKPVRLKKDGTVWPKPGGKKK